MQLEAFFKLSNTKNLAKLSTKDEVTEFLEKIIRFEISSDYDSKDNVFNNLHSTIGQNSNPEILLEFDEIDSSLEFKIIWYNEEKNILKEEEVTLNKKNTKTIIHRKFFNQTDSMTFNATGICQVEIRYLDTFIVSNAFLVIPYESENLGMFASWRSKFNIFWKLNSICFHSSKIHHTLNGNYFLYDYFPTCTQEYWSTQYPDPKSDFKISMNENRLNPTN